MERPASAPAQPDPTAHNPHPSAGLNFQKLDLPREEPLRLELEDFLYAVGARTPPRVTASAAREALALALEINHTMAQHAKKTGLLP